MIKLLKFKSNQIRFISGMHRKSLEAAEALKNDESCNSDREETTSKASDTSTSTCGQNKTPNQMASPCSSTGPTNLITTPNHSIVSPTLSTTASVHSHSSPPPSQQHPTASSTPPSHHHQQLQQQQTQQHISMENNKSMKDVSSQPHPSFHPETDPETFRLVDFRDPISFIRLIFFILFL